MKKILTVILCVFLYVNVCDAQFYKTVIQPGGFSQSIESVVQDYPSNFINIQKDFLSREEGYDLYSSAIKINGSSECIIRRYHSKYDSSASWQAVMYDGENYEQAKKIYRNTCRSVLKSKINISGYGGVGFRGEFIDVGNDISFAESLFQLKLKEERYGNFYAEVELVNTSPYSWSVNLNFFCKKKDEEK